MFQTIKGNYRAAMMLMCYYRLLTDLFSPSFSFEPIWEKLEVGGDRPLSLQFLQHANKFIRLDDALCLDDIVAEFFRRRDQMPNPTFNPVMRIWYNKDGGRTHDDHEVTYDPVVLDNYLDGVFRWWKGEEAAKGVDAGTASKRCPYVFPAMYLALYHSLTCPCAQVV